MSYTASECLKGFRSLDATDGTAKNEASARLGMFEGLPIP